MHWLSFYFGNFSETWTRNFNPRDALFLLFNFRDSCVGPPPPFTPLLVVSLCAVRYPKRRLGFRVLVHCLFVLVLLFSRNKILIRKQKNIYLAFYRPLINPSASERFVYIIIHFHLVFQFDRINSLSGNFYLSSLVDFSALWTNISAGVTIIYNKKVFILVRSRPQGLLGFENEKILGTSLQIFRQMVSIRVKTLSNTNLAASRHIKREKAHFRLTLRHSKMPLLIPLMK